MQQFNCVEPVGYDERRLFKPINEKKTPNGFVLYCNVLYCIFTGAYWPAVVVEKPSNNCSDCQMPRASSSITSAPTDLRYSILLNMYCVAHTHIARPRPAATATAAVKDSTWFSWFVFFVRIPTGCCFLSVPSKQYFSNTAVEFLPPLPVIHWPVDRKKGRTALPTSILK